MRISLHYADPSDDDARDERRDRIVRQCQDDVSSDPDHDERYAYPRIHLRRFYSTGHTFTAQRGRLPR